MSESETEAAAELDKAIEKLHTALQTLKLTDLEQQLEELCEMMAKQELPIAARLFILGQGVHTLKDIDAKDQALIDAAEESLQLGFRIRDLKNFVSHCKEGSHDYDYVEGQGTAAKAKMSASSSDSGQRPPLPLRNESSSIASGSSDPRLSTDPGYWSRSELQTPMAKPRRPSLASQQEVASSGSAVSAVRGYRGSDTGKMPAPTTASLRPAGNGGGIAGRTSTNRLLRLFVFPDKVKKQKQLEKHQALYTT